MTSYTVSRSTTIAAPLERVRALLVDLREWQQWSPWEGLDDNLQRTYSGAEQGVGQHYEWSGNKKAGAGSMDVEAVTARQVRVGVSFLKPFKSTSTSTFDLAEADGTTTVTWTMTGEQNALMGLVGKVYPMDRMIGPDFEKGLAQLKRVAETR